MSEPWTRLLPVWKWCVYLLALLVWLWSLSLKGWRHHGTTLFGGSSSDPAGFWREDGGFVVVSLLWGVLGLPGLFCVVGVILTPFVLARGRQPNGWKAKRVVLTLLLLLLPAAELLLMPLIGNRPWDEAVKGDWQDLRYGMVVCVLSLVVMAMAVFFSVNQSTPSTRPGGFEVVLRDDEEEG